MTGRKFVPSIKNTNGNLHIVVRRKISWSGQWKVGLFQIPKRNVSACECSGNNIKLSQCQRDISRHVQACGLSINRDEISDEMDDEKSKDYCKADTT